MEFIGQVEGLNTRPIGGYNQFLKGNASFDISVDGNDFDSVLKAESVKQRDRNANTLAGKIGSAFSGSLDSVSDKMESANRAQEAFAMGEDISVHEVMIESQKASLSMQMALQVRNKILSAYSELNNIRI